MSCVDENMQTPKRFYGSGTVQRFSLAECVRLYKACVYLYSQRSILYSFLFYPLATLQRLAHMRERAMLRARAL